MAGYKDIIEKFINQLKTCDQRFDKNDLKANLPAEIRYFDEATLTWLFHFAGYCYQRLQNNSNTINAKTHAEFTQGFLFNKLKLHNQQIADADSFKKLISETIYDELMIDVDDLCALYLKYHDIDIEKLFENYQACLQPTFEAQQDEAVAAVALLANEMHDLVVGRQFTQPEDFSDFVDKIGQKGELIRSLTFVNAGELYIDNLILLLMTLPNLQKLELRGNTSIKYTIVVEKEQETTAFSKAISGHKHLEHVMFSQKLPDNIFNNILFEVINTTTREVNHPLHIFTTLKDYTSMALLPYGLTMKNGKTDILRIHSMDTSIAQLCPVAFKRLTEEKKTLLNEITSEDALKIIGNDAFSFLDGDVA